MNNLRDYSKENAQGVMDKTRNQLLELVR